MVFNLITCIPLSINPCRREMYLNIFKKEQKGFSHVIITIIMVWLTAVIGTAFPDVINAFSMLGGFCAVPIVIYYPGISYIKIFKGRCKWYEPKKLFVFIMTILLSLLGLIAAFISLFDMVGLLKVDAP